MKTVYEMAREANRYADTHADSTDCDWPLVRDERFAELVRADAIADAVEREREACAKVCDEIYFQNYPDAEEWERSEEGEAIRKRSHV